MRDSALARRPSAHCRRPVGCRRRRPMSRYRSSLPTRRSKTQESRRSDRRARPDRYGAKGADVRENSADAATSLRAACLRRATSGQTGRAAEVSTGRKRPAAQLGWKISTLRSHPNRTLRDSKLCTASKRGISRFKVKPRTSTSPDTRGSEPGRKMVHPSTR